MSVRRISMSSVPCTISPPGCEFCAIIFCSPRTSMGIKCTPLECLWEGNSLEALATAGDGRFDFSHSVHDGVRAFGRNVVPAVFDKFALPAAGKPCQAQLQVARPDSLELIHVLLAQAQWDGRRLLAGSKNDKRFITESARGARLFRAHLDVIEFIGACLQIFRLQDEVRILVLTA